MRLGKKIKIKIKLHLAVAVLFASLYSGCSSAQEVPAFKITVSIDYGSARSGRDTLITSDRQLTALEALQYAAKVETHPVGHYVFITSIDGVEGQRGVMGWYYEVNGQPSKTLAINNTLKNGDILCWIYKKDVCSIKVDKPACH